MVKKNKKPLGRGLSALLGDATQKPVLLKQDDLQKTVPIELLHTGKYQPRRSITQELIDDLASSIREKGIIQPILVRKSKKDDASGTLAKT